MGGTLISEDSNAKLPWLQQYLSLSVCLCIFLSFYQVDSLFGSLFLPWFYLSLSLSFCLSISHTLSLPPSLWFSLSNNLLWWTKSWKIHSSKPLQHIVSDKETAFKMMYINITLLLREELYLIWTRCKPGASSGSQHRGRVHLYLHGALESLTVPLGVKSTINNYRAGPTV